MGGEGPAAVRDLHAAAVFVGALVEVGAEAMRVLLVALDAGPAVEGAVVVVAAAAAGAAVRTTLGATLRAKLRATVGAKLADQARLATMQRLAGSRHSSLSVPQSSPWRRAGQVSASHRTAPMPHGAIDTTPIHQ
jgi:hypothetical protein